MVYKHLDPARDWDAWCDDHPEPPESCYVPHEFWYYSCSECGDKVTDDCVEIYAEYAHLPTEYKCLDCGGVCYHEDEYNIEAYLAHCREEAEEAKAEAQYDRMMSDLYDGRY